MLYNTGQGVDPCYSNLKLLSLRDLCAVRRRGKGPFNCTHRCQLRLLFLSIGLPVLLYTTFHPPTAVCTGSNMSVRVVARIRPLLEGEAEKDVIVRADSRDGSQRPTVVKIPNPKNESEDFNFSFGGVYDQSATQEALFTAEGRSTFVPSISTSHPLTVSLPSQSLPI